MMFRPRESHDLRLVDSDLQITPRPVELRWLHDPFDNSVAVAQFEGKTTELSFESTVRLQHFENTMPVYPLEEYARTYPFRYADEDFPNLERPLAHHYNATRVSEWALQFLASADTSDTMQILRAMTAGIREKFKYNQRSEKGVQTPEETLELGKGSCRDYAVLMMEACRSLGIAARFVSGYIFVPNQGGADDASSATRGGGATHAWMQAYLPGAGWIDFDPTNNIIGNRNLIRVAVAWSPEQVLPLWGTYSGPAGAFISMDVAVDVTEAAG